MKKMLFMAALLAAMVIVGSAPARAEVETVVVEAPAETPATEPGFERPKAETPAAKPAATSSVMRPAATEGQYLDNTTSRDEVARRQIVGLKGELAGLRARRNREIPRARRSGDWRRFKWLGGQISAADKKLDAAEKRIEFLETNPLGGTSESHTAVYRNLSSAGFLTQTSADKRYLTRREYQEDKKETKPAPAATAPESKTAAPEVAKEKGMTISPFWGGVLALLVVVLLAAAVGAVVWYVRRPRLTAARYGQILTAALAGLVPGAAPAAPGAAAPGGAGGAGGVGGAGGAGAPAGAAGVPGAGGAGGPGGAGAPAATTPNLTVQVDAWGSDEEGIAVHSRITNRS